MEPDLPVHLVLDTHESEHAVLGCLVAHAQRGFREGRIGPIDERTVDDDMEFVIAAGEGESLTKPGHVGLTLLSIPTDCWAAHVNETVSAILKVSYGAAERSQSTSSTRSPWKKECGSPIGYPRNPRPAATSSSNTTTVRRDSASALTSLSQGLKLPTRVRCEKASI